MPCNPLIRVTSGRHAYDRTRNLLFARPIGRRKKEVIFGLGKSNSTYQTNKKESIMKAAAPLQLREAGQSLWLDNITRDLLTSGTLKRYIDELSITGLTSNPTIFDHAITKSQAYDAAIRQKIRQVKSDEEIFFALAIEDLTQAADLFRPIYDATDGVDGWVSLEVSPLLAYDTASTIAQAKELHTRAGRSTSRCSSLASTMWPLPTPTCVASSAVSRLVSLPMCVRWLRCSSAAGTKP